MTVSTSSHERWYRYFLEKSQTPICLPWSDTYRLNAAELDNVSHSIQQFQLGEWARGRGLKRRATKHRVFAGDPWFVPALELFIAEEQGHSSILGQFLDHQRIPRLSNNWLDAAFRRLRKLAGLEVCATVLVTAEVLAMPFYQALRDATRSHLLHSICIHILIDEAAHLNYQALTIGLLRRPLSDRARAIHAACHSVFFHGTALLLWQQHRKVFRAAGWDFRRFWVEARLWFAILQLRIRQVSLHWASADALRELRLD